MPFGTTNPEGIRDPASLNNRDTPDSNKNSSASTTPTNPDNTTPSATPIQIHIPPTLTPFALPLASFKSLHPSIKNFATTTFIFPPSSPSHTTTTPTLLLLLQRAPTEPAFANKWETPGGRAEDTDPTLLHTAARETFEETGLRLTRFVRQVGERVDFETGREGEMWVKFGFEVEVQEMGDGVGEVEIRLDPEEHQAFAWASEEDVRGERFAVTTVEQRGLMLEAFKKRRGEGGGVKDLVDVNGAAGGDKAVA